MRPFGSSSWSDVWDRQSGTAGALVHDNAGSRERTSDIRRPQSPPRFLSTQSQNWGGGRDQQFAPPRRQRGTWKPPRGSQYREPRDVRPRTPPRLQASNASLRERLDRQRDRTPPNDRVPFNRQTASYVHTRGPPPRSGVPLLHRSQSRTPRPLPADHPLMVEMAELKRTRDTRKRYWAGLIPNLGDEWQNPASIDRQQWEEEENLADNKFADLAGQIKMAEMGMSEEIIGYAHDGSGVASTASLGNTRSRETGKPFRPQPDGGYLKRVPEYQRRGGMPHLNQGSYRSRNQSDGRMPHQDVMSRYCRNQTGNIIPRHHHNSRNRRQPTRGRRDHFVNKQPRTWMEQEKDKNVRNWMEGIGLGTGEKRDSLASSWMDESGAPPGFTQKSHQRNYMNDISSESDVGGLVRSIEIDKPEYSGPASVESGEARVEPAIRKVSGVADDGSKIGDHTRIGELGVRGQIEQTREAAQDDWSFEGSFESFRSLRYSSSNEEVDEQQKAIDDRDFEEAEAERENESIELGRRMIFQQSSGTTPKPNTDVPHTKSYGTTPKPNTDIPHIKSTGTASKPNTDVPHTESTRTASKPNTDFPHIKLENTSVDITPILKGALPLNRATNFSHARLSSIAIPAFARNSHLIVAHSSSNNEAPRSSLLTSSNLATHQTAFRNSRPGISSSANFLNLRALRPPSSTQLTESSTSDSPGLDSAAQDSSSDSLRNPTSRTRRTAPNPNALTS
ncbi:MAG: hypothetical protein M1835_000798, partial [Candelina submexicana]